MKIFGYLKKYWYAVLVVIVLLVVQAYSDLSLPNLTSEIVDTGIMQGGIEYATPTKIRTESMDLLQLFMTDKEKKLIQENYKLEGKVYVLHKKEDVTEEKLSNTFSLPMMMVLGSEKKDKSLKDLKQLLLAPEEIKTGEKKLSDAQKKLNEGKTKIEMGLKDPALSAEMQAQLNAQLQGLNAEQAKLTASQKQLTESKQKLAEGQKKLLEARSEAKKKLGDLSANSTTQMGIEYVRAEYKAVGIDTKKIQTDYMKKIGTKMVLLTFISGASAVIVGLIGSLVAANVSRNLRVRQYERTLQFSNAEMDKFSTASLITRNTNDIQQIQMALVLAIRLVFYAPILGLGGVYMVARTQTGMGWIIGVAVGSVLLLVVTLLATAMPKFKALQGLVDKVNLVSREILTGLSVIRAFTREKTEEKRFDKANTELMKTQMFVNRAMSLMMPIMMLLMNAITVLIIWVGGHGMDKGNLQVGDMMAFITYTMQIVMAFMMLSMVSIILPRANVAAVRVEEVLNTIPTIHDKKEVRDEVAYQGKVKFEGVSFRFPNANEDVLHHLNFVAKPGETTAIIGSTGSGKSTIVNLIPRFFDVSTGRITIDDVDIRDMSLHKLHELMGVVPQKGVLFSGDIESNIKFGDAVIDDEIMKKAADIAQATEFISQNEEGFARAISQGGSNVSGGQKQRLSIARAIAKNPKILIFDDSFSALDNKTDVAVRSQLAKEVKHATMIIVAQKISTILHADNIVVLNEGRIVAQGTHEQLLATNTTYQEIAQSQLSNAELGLEEAE